MTSKRLHEAVAELVAALNEEIAGHAASAPLPPRLLSIAETAQALGLARSNVYRFITDGSLQSVKVGARRLVSEAALADFINSIERSP